MSTAEEPATEAELSRVDQRLRDALPPSTLPMRTAISIVETVLSEARAFRSSYIFGNPSGVVAVFDENCKLLAVGSVECGTIISMPPKTDDLARSARWASVPAAKLKALTGGHDLHETSSNLWMGLPQRLALITSDWLFKRGLQIQGAAKVDGLGFVATQLRNDTKFECQLIDMALSAAGFIRRDWPAGFVNLDGRKYAVARPGWVTYMKANDELQ